MPAQGLNQKHGLKDTVPVGQERSKPKAFAVPDYRLVQRSVFLLQPVKRQNFQPVMLKKFKGSFRCEDFCIELKILSLGFQPFIQNQSRSPFGSDNFPMRGYSAYYTAVAIEKQPHMAIFLCS